MEITLEVKVTSLHDSQKMVNWGISKGEVFILVEYGGDWIKSVVFTKKNGEEVQELETLAVERKAGVGRTKIIIKTKRGVFSFPPEPGMGSLREFWSKKTKKSVKRV